MNAKATTIYIFGVCISLFCSATLADETASSLADDSLHQVNTCTGCHNSIINLKGRGVELIIKQTKAIQSEQKPHPAAGIKALTDEDIKIIAEFLNTD